MVKQDGFFVCQHCQTKYSVEEAKKMMAGDTVSVVGTVSVDESSKVKQMLSIAEVNLDGGDYEGVVRQCEKILDLDAQNHRAYYLMARSTGWGSSLDDNKVGKAIAYAKMAVKYCNDDNEKSKISSELWEHIKAQIYGLMLYADKIIILNLSQANVYFHTLLTQKVETISALPDLPIDILKDELNEMYEACENGAIKGLVNSSITGIAKVSFASYNGGVSYADQLSDAILPVIEKSDPSYAQRMAQVKNWSQQGLCTKCGSKMKGMLTKKCKVCG
jgi:hypothetical protein